MKLGTIIAIIVVLVGCGVAGTQMMSVGAPNDDLEKSKKRMQNAEKSAKIERNYPAPVAIQLPPPMKSEPTGGGKPPNTSIERKPVLTVENKTDTVSKQLFNAALAFVIPDKANVNEEIKAQLLINPTKDLEKLEKELTKKGSITTKEIKVSKVVKSTLTAPDFEVTKITDEEQILSENDSTEWLWALSPKSSGKYDVNLSVTAIINVNGKETKHHLKTFEKTITIEITPKQIIISWLEKYWQWLFSTLLLPLGLWLYKKFDKNHSPSS